MADHTPPPAPAFVLQPMVHVDDMPASIAFYERLGGSIVHGGRDAEWVLMQLGTTQIGLLARPPRSTAGESTVELNFLCTTPLDQLEKQLHHSGVTVTTMVNDRTFGNQLHVQSPDGLLIKINEMDPVPVL
jgi:catechol 2,3-dioxygenase-like lactoylglutathione lyase family enzyme